MSHEVEIKNDQNIYTKRGFKRSYFSLNDSDIQTLWDFVSEFIESTMQKLKGVNINGLGTFSFSQVKLDIGQNKYVLLQRPLFILSEKICQTHGLKQGKVQVTGSIPVITLNYSSLMMKSSYSRDQVETCVRELITATNNSIASQNTTELVFSRIGRLQISNQTVKFKFYKSFIATLDNTGKIINAMQNRPGTADSVMSERPASRPFSNIIPLPRISSSKDFSKLPIINETDAFESRKSDFDNENNNILSLDEDIEANYSGCIDTEEGIQMESFKHCSTSSSESNNNEEPSNDVRSTNSDQIVSVDSHPVNNELSNSEDLSKSHHINDNIEDNKDPLLSLNLDSNISLSCLPPPKVPSRSLLLFETKRPESAYSSNRPSTSSSSVCGHSGPSGQELCYVCYQREKRNIPISFTEELKEREKEEERVLQAFQNMKDTEHLIKEQTNILSKKHDSQKVSAFNAGVAEAIRSQQRAKDPNMYRSYIFENRPLTPPKTIKQNILNSQLGKQVEYKANAKKKSEDDEAFMERLEQMQLAEDLAKQRNQYLKDKERSVDLYKKALDMQMDMKSLSIPKYEADSAEPFFGKNDVTQDKLTEKRQKAKDIQKSLLDSAEQKKRDLLMKKLQEQTYEEQILDKTKQDLIEDRARRYERTLHNRLKLEAEWEKAKNEKKEKDLVERITISMPDTVLMHEQCDKYSRCAQCKRKVHNHGNTNIWKETYFVPGTRYIY